MADLEKDGVKPEKHIYKTGEHQFFDNSLPGYDEALSRQLLDNINAFLKYGSKP